MSSYCQWAIVNPWHQPYHDTEYGFPTEDESALFERLALEINQAGLSWLTVLKKRPAFQAAFDGFDVDRVAKYSERDRERLLGNGSIIRNRMKIDAVIHNAGVIRRLRDSHGGFHAWIAANHPRTKADWVKLFRSTFRFTGGEIVGEFLMSTGWLPGTHNEACPAYGRIAALDPPWMQAVRAGFDYDAV